MRSSTVSAPSAPLTPPQTPPAEAEARAAEPTVAAPSFPPAAAQATPSWTPPQQQPPPITPVTPVQFEAVEPDRRKKRIIITVVTVVLVLIAGVGGFFIGTSGDDGDDSKTTANSSTSPSGSGAPAVTVPNLVGWWKLADGQGATAVDATGKHPAGTAGAVDWSQDKGGSVVLSGSGSLATSKAVIDTSQSFTISAWAKLGDMNGNKTVVAQDGANVSGFYLHFNHTANTWAFVRTSDDAPSPATWYTALSTAPPNKDQWTHLVGVYDAAAGQITLYVDGKAQKTVTGLGPGWKADGPLTIGRAKNNSDLFTGGIADVEAFDRVLTPEEIQSLGTNPGLAGAKS